MQNIGKVLEEEIKASMPQDVYYYRFKDNAASFGGGNNTRFTSHNICDCMAITNDYVFLLELKSHKGSSIPFTCIRKNQIEEMSKVDHIRIKPYFILNYREKEMTYGVEAKKLKNFMETTERKSIPFDWCRENGIEITGIKKKVRFKYELEEFFNKASHDHHISWMLV